MRRVLGFVATLLALALVGLAAWVFTYKPAQREAPDLTIDLTRERVERGSYLANTVLSCFACHTQRDWSKWGGPMIGPHGAGGESWVKEYGFPGRLFATNLTSDPKTGLGEWTDGEILRALREGIGRDGRGLFPIMPYAEYRRLSDEDAMAVVAYLRTLAPVDRSYPEPEIDFPMSFFSKLAPEPLEAAVPEPDREEPAAYGEYLATVGGCRMCHTPIDFRHLPIEDQAFAGGQRFEGDWGVAVTANLTSHPEGIGNYTRENFVNLFRSFRHGVAEEPARPGSVMPWLSLCDLEDADLHAIFAYLQTVPPLPDHAP